MFTVVLQAVQYNTLILPFFLKHTKLRSAYTRLSGADAVVLQSNCVRRTFARSLHSSLV